MTTVPEISDRSRGAALALAALLGPLGAHRFYVGKIGTGILMLATLGGLGVWWVYDLIVVATGGFRDSDGRRVLRWVEPEAGAHDSAMDDLRRDVEAMGETMYAMRTELTELAERVDFVERVVERTKSPPGIPPRA